MRGLTPYHLHARLHSVMGQPSGQPKGGGRTGATILKLVEEAGEIFAEYG
jgi:hypothetical protein